MPNIGLGLVEGIYASRAIGGNGEYMPDATTILTKSGGATSDAWGAAMLAGLAAGEGYLVSPGQDISIQFVGNTGEGVVQEFDPVANDWITKIVITDAVMHVVRAPLGPFRIGCVTDTNTTHVKMRTARQSGTP